MESTKSILLIGRTGSGKSTLANVITGTSKFKESSSGVSETKEIQVEELKFDGINYRVIDTVGIGDTSMATWEVLYKLAKMSNSVKNGLSQIFFLVDKNGFTDDIKETYKFLKEFVFDEEIINYITIVRTNFPGFRDPNKCNKEREKIQEKEEDEEIKLLIEKCSEKIIFLDNPPIEDEDSRVQSENRRKYSKDILEIHLEKLFQGDNFSTDEDYKPIILNKLNDKVDNSITKEKVLKGEKRKYSRKEKENELRKSRREIVEKILDHATEIDPNFSGEEIKRQLDELEKRETNEGKIIHLPFNWKWWKKL